MATKMINTSYTLCKQCHWSISVGAGIACYYYIMTGEHRDCPTGKCDKFMTLNKKEKDRWLKENSNAMLDAVASQAFKNARTRKELADEQQS